MQPGAAYTYRFAVQSQDGTLWWHAYSRWMRATIYGALVIYPKVGVHYPFQNHPDKDFPVILGECVFIIHHYQTYLRVAVAVAASNAMMMLISFIKMNVFSFSLNNNRRMVGHRHSWHHATGFV